MSALTAALRGRRRAESLMLDTCTIKPITGNTTDPTTGVVTPVYGEPSYTGKCKIQAEAPVRSNPAAGEHVWVLGRTAIHLPVIGSGDVESNHLVEITASVDPSNVGRQFRVHSGDRKTLQTAYRLLVEEVIG